MLDLHGRKEVFRALVGSHNYNLNVEGSDKDYKLFVIPTFDDLYYRKQFSKCYIGQTEDFDCHDIRKMSSLFWNANVDFLEVLFSDEINVNPKLNSDSVNYLSVIFRSKDEIARMNLPYLYDTCIGMHKSKRSHVDKGTEGTKHLVDKYGYNTKKAMHSLRILDFLNRFAQTDFDDFKHAISYNLNDEQDSYGKYLLSINAGELTRDEYIKVSEERLCWIEDNFKSLYREQKPNMEINEYLIEMIKEVVKNEMLMLK